MAGITRHCTTPGRWCLDLCHSAGVVEIAFDRHAVDSRGAPTSTSTAAGIPGLHLLAKPIRRRRNIPCRAGGARRSLAFDPTSDPTRASGDSLRDAAIISLRGVRCARCMQGSRCGIATEESRSHGTLHGALGALLPGLDIVTPTASSRGSQVGISFTRDTQWSSDDRTRRDRHSRPI